MASPLAVVRVERSLFAGGQLTPVAWDPGAPSVKVPEDPDRLIIDCPEWGVDYWRPYHGADRGHDHREGDPDINSDPNPRKGRLSCSDQSHHDNERNHAFPQVSLHRCFLLLRPFAKLDSQIGKGFSRPKNLASEVKFCYQ